MKDRKLLIDLIEKGVSYEEIRKITSYSRVAYFRTKRKIGKTKQIHILDTVLEKEIVADRASGISIKALSEKYGLPIRTLNNILYNKYEIKLPVEMRGLNKALATLNEKGFKTHEDWLAYIAQQKEGKFLGPYIGYKLLTKWECRRNHIFDMTPNHVTSQKQWCPICAHIDPSEPELEILNYIKSLNLDCEIYPNDRSIINPLELDVYIPKFNFALEYNGLYRHSLQFQEKSYHYKKFKLCEAKNVKLFSIFGDEWESKKDLIKAMIRWRLHKFNGLNFNARDLELKKITKNNDFNSFFERNHIDGHKMSSYAYGLFYNNKLVMCASVKRNHNGELELTRLATDYDYNVRGGAGKLIAAIKNDINGPLVSFSNNRLSHGNVYRQLGFNYLGETTTPSYWYTDGRVRLWRFKCKRINEPEILAKYPSEKAQAEGGVFSRKYLNHERPLYKIEDCKHKKWILI